MKLTCRFIFLVDQSSRGAGSVVRRMPGSTALRAAASGYVFTAFLLLASERIVEPFSSSMLENLHGFWIEFKNKLNFYIYRIIWLSQMIPFQGYIFKLSLLPPEDASSGGETA